MKNLQSRIERKAWSEIQKIQKSSNLVSIESAMNDAVLKTFSMWDCGMQQIIARQNGTLKKYLKVKQIREHLTMTYKKEIKKYLMSFINSRFQHCLMYKNLIKELN